MMRPFSLLLTSFLLFQSSLHPCFPVTHVVVGERWYAHRGEDDAEEQLQFFLGTLYPDIRYIGGPNRDKTHIGKPSLQLIEEQPTPFDKGMALHAYLDGERYRMVKEWKIHEQLQALAPDLPKQDLDTFLKLIEDEVLYGDRQWLTLQRYLTTVLPQEVEGGASMTTVIEWHMILARYFSDSPSSSLAFFKVAGRGFLGRPAPLVAIWADALPKLSQHPTMQNYVHRLVEHLDRQFSQRR